MQMKVFAALIFLSLVACRGESDSPREEPATPPESSVFDPMIDTLERAESVEDTLRESADERRRQLEEAGI